MHGEATVLLGRLRAGEADAAEELFALLYQELRSVAGRIFGSRNANHTLQPTVLVHEAYLKMVGPARSAEDAAPHWEDRVHFCNAAARAMRQILINHARDQRALKRGGADRGARVTIAGVVLHDTAREVDAIDLHEAIEALQQLDARQARLCELRFFGGLNLPECANVLDVSQRTIEMDWRMAKGWLADRFGAE